MYSQKIVVYVDLCSQPEVFLDNVISRIPFHRAVTGVGRVNSLLAQITVYTFWRTICANDDAYLGLRYIAELYGVRLNNELQTKHLAISFSYCLYRYLLSRDLCSLKQSIAFDMKVIAWGVYVERFQKIDRFIHEVHFGPIERCDYEDCGMNNVRELLFIGNISDPSKSVHLAKFYNFLKLYGPIAHKGLFHSDVSNDIKLRERCTNPSPYTLWSWLREFFRTGFARPLVAFKKSLGGGENAGAVTSEFSSKYERFITQHARETCLRTFVYNCSLNQHVNSSNGDAREGRRVQNDWLEAAFAAQEAAEEEGEELLELGEQVERPDGTMRVRVGRVWVTLDQNDVAFMARKSAKGEGNVFSVQ